MVFNWFRRQFNDRSDQPQDSSPETVAEPTEVEEVAEPEPTEEPSQEIAEDYLSWAKAAYQNIQKKQAQSAEPEAETPVETAPEPDAAPAEAPAEPAITETVAEAPAETSELVEAETPEPEVPEAATLEAEATETETLEAEETEAEATEAIAEPPTPIEEPGISEVTPPEPEAIEEPEATEAPGPTLEAETAADTAEAPETEPAIAEVIPEETEPAIAPEPVESAETEAIAQTPEEAPTATAPMSFLARAEAERQARLERLRATAIEEPEPVVAQPAAVTTSPLPETFEGMEGVAFDEGFLWSAEVLASQGRRPDQVSLEEITWLKRLRQGLDKTRRSLVNQLKAIVGQGPLNQDAVMEIEALLLQADVGVEATDHIIEALQKRLREETLPPEQAIAYLKQILRDMLDRPLGKSYNPTFAPEKETLNIWLMTGVNGAGKTTTIGKLAHLAQKSDYNCLIAAADTFRAAAVEQVRIWGQRSGVEVISNPGKNTDPAAVVFDAITAAKSRDAELLLVDTAGRLQNKKNLMEELSKIRRIIDKKAPEAKVESLLVLDATLGQNGLRQAQVFSEAAQLSGVVLTKLDGTAKGGVALAVVQQLGLPIRFIGAGEGIEDLRPFSSYEFVEALLSG